MSNVRLDGTTHPDFRYTFEISGTVTAADEGKAVALDATKANTVKLAGENDVVIGRLFKYEDRVVEGVKLATVETKGGMRLPKDDYTVVIAVGASVIGAGAGLVKAAGTATPKNYVVESADNYVVVMFE